MFLRLLLLLSTLYLLTACSDYSHVTPEDIKELAVRHFREKKTFQVKDTGDVNVLLVNSGAGDQWYVAFNAVMGPPALFLYHISRPFEPPHYIPLSNKSEAIIEHVDFENVTNDDDYELVIELHFDYGIPYQGREITILRNPFGSPAYEIFSFPYEQVWETIDTFDIDYGLPSHTKRIENHSNYEFFEGFILIKGIINYRPNHLVEYKWDAGAEEFVLILDEDLHEEEDEKEKGHDKITHKVKGNKILVEVTAHEEHCVAYVIEDSRGHVLDLDKKIHDELLCSPVTSLSDDGRHLIYTDHARNAICVYDFTQKTIQVLLKDFSSYEGVSEVDWAPGSSLRFAFISVNHEETLSNTNLHVFTFDKKRNLSSKTYHIKMHYDCDLEGLCVPTKDYHYKFKNYNSFLYSIDGTGAFKTLVL